MSRILRHLTPALCLLLLAACGTTSTRNPMQMALGEYAAAIRWNEFSRAEEFLDPLYRESHALSDLERERLKLIQVTGYEVKRSALEGEGVLEQEVEIRVVGRLTQEERRVLDHQRWRYDEAGKRWWLMTGLPDFGKE